MTKHLINPISFFLENIAAGVWVGALLTFGIAVARPVFRGLPSVTLAGSITAEILQRINVIEMSAATLMVIAAGVFLVQRERRTPLRIAKTVLLGFMAACLIYYGTVIMDRMEYLRTVEIENFDRVDESTRAARDEFDGLHKRYTRLASMNVWMGVGFLLLSAFERRKEGLRFP
jgi:Domain of unknown function (DUF4149)